MDQIRRHVNGGAQKVGSEVHVSADSFCDDLTQLYGSSTVLHSTLIHTWLRSSHLFSVKMTACSIGDSVASESSLAALMARDCTFDRVRAYGDPAGALKLTSVIAEDCQLHGNWTLEGNARIPTGIWHRAPRFCRIIGENGVDTGLTESTEGHAIMACWRKPISKWLYAGPRLGQKHGWTEKQVNDARLFFEMLADVPIEGVIPSAT